MSIHYLTFDPPVSVNKLYEPKYGGGVRLSNEARNWKEYAKVEAYNQWNHKPLLTGFVAVTYRFFGTRMDWDNGCKILGDAMNKIVYLDDKQIIEAHVYLHRTEKGHPRVDVEIQTIG